MIRAQNELSCLYIEFELGLTMDPELEMKPRAKRVCRTHVRCAE